MNKHPYEECDLCNDLGDCKHPDVEHNLMGSMMPPHDCPKPIDVMRATLKYKKIKHSKYEGV